MTTKAMRVGIFFGGQSREREISFAGGRTVFDNLDKSLFSAIPIFVDSLGNFIELDWQYIYKGTIRDFYPPSGYLPKDLGAFQVYIESLQEQKGVDFEGLIGKIGRKIEANRLSEHIDFAFLALHGPYGEDGNIQGLLEWYNVPYSGCGILPSAIGIDKSVQKDLLKANDFATPKHISLTKEEITNGDLFTVFQNVKKKIGLPFVVKAPNQGSSIGISIVTNDDITVFNKALKKSLFIEEVNTNDWQQKSEEEKDIFISELIDIRSGIGLPLVANDKVVYLPKVLKKVLDEANAENDILTLTAISAEQEVLIEEFIEGREFSCIVIEDEQGIPVALPPTEILKGKELFDYRAKYLPGISRKLTPIQIKNETLADIRSQCERLFSTLGCEVYARLDGFVNDQGKVFLNDPNTTSGMLPSSFFFHQAAEISLNPSQLITYIIRTSLKNRIKRGKNSHFMIKSLISLDHQIDKIKDSKDSRIPVGVVMGGYSSERHISVESGRNIFEKLSSSTTYKPIPIFLSGSEKDHELHVIPINVMLKDNADDILEKIGRYEVHPAITEIKNRLSKITSTYAGQASKVPTKISISDLKDMVDFVFIALHGRPGEDGALQRLLLTENIPFNGSGVESSQLTINKYEANEVLRKNGILVADHALISRNSFENSPEAVIEKIESNFSYPLIAKPADDGCSSAVKKIKSRIELEAFIRQMFRTQDGLLEEERLVLALKKNEEFPIKDHVLIEELIESNGAEHFLEITGGMLTTHDEQGEIHYEVFEPSEALAGGEVLSLEEKFLAGEGQNITPARFSIDADRRSQIATSVRASLGKVARILNVEGYCRIDAFVRIFPDRIETIIIEVNSLPGMTPATCIFHQAAINGYTPYDFIDNIIRYGKERQKVALLN